jgi:ComF family protein
MSRLRELARELLDFVLPPVCGACGGPTAGAALCPRCDELPCDPLPPPPRPIRAWAAGVAYEGSAAEWIRRFKYPKPGFAGLDPSADGVVRAFALRAAATLGGAPDVVIPVPLHPRRLRERGFNPAGELARAIARERRVRFEPTGVARIRDTPSQTGLALRERARNVAGAFAVIAPPPERVWLVDDVITTGATLRALARALRRAGAREIRALAAAWRPLR